MQGIHTAQGTSKESVRNYARALLGWDSGSVSVWVLATRVETRPQASIISVPDLRGRSVSSTGLKEKLFVVPFFFIVLNFAKLLMD